VRPVFESFRALVGEREASATESADPLVHRSPGSREDLGFFSFSRPAKHLRPAPHPPRTLCSRRVAAVHECNQFESWSGSHFFGSELMLALVYSIAWPRNGAFFASLVARPQVSSKPRARRS